MITKRRLNYLTEQHRRQLYRERRAGLTPHPFVSSRVDGLCAACDLHRTDLLHLPAETYAPCARCGREQRLVWTGKLWLQPPHGCVEEER